MLLIALVDRHEITTKYQWSSSVIYNPADFWGILAIFSYCGTNTMVKQKW